MEGLGKAGTVIGSADDDAGTVKVGERNGRVVQLEHFREISTVQGDWANEIIPRREANTIDIHVDLNRPLSRQVIVSGFLGLVSRFDVGKSPADNVLANVRNHVALGIGSLGRE
jgi:hypothetical protein